MTTYRIPGPPGATRPAPVDAGTMRSQPTPAPDIIGTAAAQPLSREKARQLTPGEIEMAQSIFKDSVDYPRVKVHDEEYLWFGLQDDDTAITPNGEMYFNPKRFNADFSSASYGDRLWFMHEMTHVWQHQLGYPVKIRGALRFGLTYGYTLDTTRRLGHYNMEAQGNVLSDYWALKTYGQPPFISQMKHIKDLPLYETVLEHFLANPGDTSHLPQ
jgi:hypothetical protein